MNMKKMIAAMDKIDAPKKQKLNEMASVNISMNADSADEVGRLLELIKGAKGGHDAHALAPTDMPAMALPKPAMPANDMRGDMDNFMSIVNKGDEEGPKELAPEESADGGFGDATSEPDEEYGDTNMMIKDLSGGLNKEKKMFKKAQDGDNAMSVESIKDRLYAALTEKKAKPDFLDVDKDGDKKEPMKKAIADKGSKPKKGQVPPQFAKKK
jgi:hypothetical protein|tara:strand:+ start:69 stop:704 length:636 start_codon:yes stop_codon:yes gene_type:complete